MPDRRTLTVALHWTNALLLIVLVSGASVPLLFWAFGLTALAMTGIALGGGLLGRPGPKLTGMPRRMHPWMHRSLYALLAGVGALTLYAQIGGAVSEAALRRWYGILLGVSALHAIFHLWRHTALNDGALRTITPAFLHGNR